MSNGDVCKNNEMLQFDLFKPGSLVTRFPTSNNEITDPGTHFYLLADQSTEDAVYIVLPNTLNNSEGDHTQYRLRQHLTDVSTLRTVAEDLTKEFDPHTVGIKNRPKRRLDLLRNSARIDFKNLY